MGMERPGVRMGWRLEGWVGGGPGVSRDADHTCFRERQTNTDQCDTGYTGESGKKFSLEPWKLDSWRSWTAGLRSMLHSGPHSRPHADSSGRLYVSGAD